MLIPKQHGAWAMLVIPFTLSMMAGGSTFWHIPLFIGWLFLYLATYPLSMLMRKKKKKNYQKWAIIYSAIALLCLLPLLFVQAKLLYFGLAMIPFFFINMYFAKQNKERAFTNDVIAILVFCLGGLASYFLGANALTKEAWILFIYSFIYFLGVTFYVKAMIREKKNMKYKYYSWGYHLLLPFIALSLGAGWGTVGYVPSVFRAWYLYGKKVTIMQVGVIEIINSILFFIFMVIFVV